MSVRCKDQHAAVVCLETLRALVSESALQKISYTDASNPQAREALRRAKFKFAGRQKIIASRNWYADVALPRHDQSSTLIAAPRGFTAYNRDDFVQWKTEGRLTPDGVNAKVRPSHQVPLTGSFPSSMC
jgi:hypothetical protein